MFDVLLEGEVAGGAVLLVEPLPAGAVAGEEAGVDEIVAGASFFSSAEAAGFSPSDGGFRLLE